MTLLTDAIGVEHSRVPAGQECRIVSLVPSVTELICALWFRNLRNGRPAYVGKR